MKFLIQEISTTRKEVRLTVQPVKFNNINYYGFGTTGGNFDDGALALGSVPFDQLNYQSLGPNPAHIRLITAYLKDTLGSSEGSLNTLLMVNDQRIPIVNIVVDDINLETLSSSTTPSFIVKLLNPLPASIGLLTPASVEKQILSTQEQEVYYVSAEEPPAIIRGLAYDAGLISEVEDKEFKEDVFMNYNQITSSLQQSDEISLDSSLTGSNNLKIDYNDFSNHVHFGSAVSKIDNFKSKVSQIEDSLFKISQSLSTGSLEEADAIIQLRKHHFSNIRVIKSNFTDFEKHLYYNSDKLKYPYSVGVGVNYAKPKPIQVSEPLTNNSGFGIIHKVSGSSSGSTHIDLFKGMYEVQDKPFYNHSGSFYLSFLMRGDETINGSGGNIKWDNNQKQNIPMYPQDTLYTSSILQPSVKSGSWQRYVFLASASYWAPVESNPDIGYVNTITDFNHGSTEINILSGSAKTGSYTIQAGGRYSNLSTEVTSSGVTFSGSIVPAGELFRIYIDTDYAGAITSSYLTDIKITKENPLNCLPFSEVYSTGSDKFNTWYNDMYVSASDYDKNNVHSLLKTLPEYLAHDNIMDNNQFRTFVNMMGEQFDEAKSYVDGFGDLVKTNYGDMGVIPENLLPVLAKKYNWNFNLPFGDSTKAGFLEFFGSGPSSLDNTSNVKNNIWRNIVNSMQYMYKAKGTHRGIRALLNSYGFPPDILKIKEHGASMDKFEDNILNEDEQNVIDGLGGSSGSVSYIQKEDKLVSYVLNHSDRTIHADWGKHADYPMGIEFVMRPAASNYGNTILQSTGSAGKILWDLKLEPSGSDTIKSRLTFRVNTSDKGVYNTPTNFASMSTDYQDFRNGNFWNVALQIIDSGSNHMVGSTPDSDNASFSSLSTKITMSAQIMVGEQDGDKIKTFSISKSPNWHDGVGGGSNVRLPHMIANWWGTGSRDKDTAGNLVIGGPYDVASSHGPSGSFTGSLAEVRTWKYPLSASKFKQHILDKKSTVGNHITASMTDLIYHYRLNENHLSGALNPTIKDYNPNGPKDNPNDYTLTMTDIMTSSLANNPLYDTDTFERIQFNVGIGGSYELSDNNIIIDAERRFTDNLNPKTPSVMNVYHPLINKRKASSILELTRSPQEVINDFILNQLGNYDFNDLFADPRDARESTYKHLEGFAKDFFDYYDVSLDVNKYIRAQTKIFTKDLIDSLKRLVPARAEFSKVGVELKPTFFDRQKIQNEQIEKEILSFQADIPFTNWEEDKYSLTTIDNLQNYQINKNAHIELASHTGSSQGYYDYTNKYELHKSKDGNITLSTVSGSELYTYESELHKTKDLKVSYTSHTGSEYYNFSNHYVPSTDGHIEYYNISGSEYLGYSNELVVDKQGNLELGSITGSSQGYYDFTNKHELIKTKDAHLEMYSHTGSKYYNFLNEGGELNPSRKDGKIDISSDTEVSVYRFNKLEPIYSYRNTHISIASSTGSVPNIEPLEPLYSTKNATMDISSDTENSMYRFNKLEPLYSYRDTHISVASSTGSISKNFTTLEPLYLTKDTNITIASHTGSVPNFTSLEKLYTYKDAHISIASNTGSIPNIEPLEPLHSSKDGHMSIASSTGSIPNFSSLEKIYNYHTTTFNVASSTGSISKDFTKLEPLYKSNDLGLAVSSHTGSIPNFSSLEKLYTYRDTHFSIASSTGSITKDFTKSEPLYKTKDSTLSIASSTGSVTYDFTSLEPIYNYKDADIAVASHTGSTPLLSSTENLYQYNNTEVAVSSNTGSNPDVLSSVYDYKTGDLDTQFNTHNLTGSKTFETSRYNYKNTSVSVASSTGSNPIISSEISTPKVGTFNFIGEQTLYEKLNLSYVGFDSDWGTTNDDTHFIHYGYAGKNNDFNTYHYEKRFVFHAIGDVEFISGSVGAGGTSFETDYTGNFSTSSNGTLPHTGSQDFKNKTIIKTNEVLGFRPLGTTVEFKPSSSLVDGGRHLDENFIYPANHSFLIGTSKDSIDRLIYKGSQNEGTETLESLSFQDLDKAAFYHVLTTGNQGYTVTNDY